MHQMSLIRSGSEVMAVDNDRVVPLAMGTAELAYLDALHESISRGELKAGWMGPIDLGALPTLRIFVEDIFSKYHLPGEVHATWHTAVSVSPSNGR